MDALTLEQSGLWSHAPFWGRCLSLYGLVHLLGFVVYWRLSEVKGLSYRTATLSGGHKAGGARAWVFGECLLFGEHRGSGGGATLCPGFKAATALH